MTDLITAARAALAYMDSIGPTDMYQEEAEIAEGLRAALRAAEHGTALLKVAQDLLAESEEYEFADGLGRGVPQQYWDALQDALEFGGDE